MAELMRVTRLGGRTALIDTDWGMHAVHGVDPGLTEAILDAWRDNAANGLSGRRLSALFADAGMRTTTLVAESWLSRLTHAGQRGRFFPAVTMFAVGATRA